MENGFNNFISTVKEKTGIDLTVYSDNGEKICGVGESTLSFNVEKIYSDTANGKTYFSMQNNGKEFVGCIDGISESEQKMAMLISALSENFDFRKKTLSKEEFYKNLLKGSVKFSEFREYIRSAEIIDGQCFCSIISTNGNVEEVKEVLINYGNTDTDVSVSLDNGLLAFIKFIGEEGFEYASATEFAEYLNLSVKEELGFDSKIFVGGTVNSLYDLNVSYSQALSTFTVGNDFNFREGVYSYKNYVLLNVLGDLPKNKIEEYLTALTDEGAKEIFSDKEMITTAEEFLNNDLNISETSRKLFLHRNTLMYRLDKIEKVTGLDIRKFSDAATFRLIIMLKKLLK